jgi:hypothetical protein
MTSGELMEPSSFLGTQLVFLGVILSALFSFFTW